ncbi:unnamed protein product [Caenorhabditis angaria]|uniref:Uncharacterized protein n=1 Tax=Caenorhabditis angaria TaxID=860376 RepID=A0A9P1MXQ5_9PELO|nr:unnamed protein product [Caenorhabditis angaria]
MKKFSKLIIFQLQILNYLVHSQQYFSQSKCENNGKIHEFLVLSELPQEAEKSVCVEFYESELENVLKDLIKSEVMRKFRQENRVKLEKVIGENYAIYIAFRRKNPLKTTTIEIAVSNDESRYFARIEIFPDFKVKLSSHTEMNVQPVISQISKPSDYFQIQIRFVDGRVKLTNILGSEPDLIAEISLSLKSKFQSDLVKMENLNVFEMVYHENCGLKNTYEVSKTIKRETSKEARDFERSTIELWNSETQMNYLSLKKTTDWVETLMFHVFNRKENAVDFRIRYISELKKKKVRGKENLTSYDYELKDNTIFLEKMWWKWVHSNPFGSFEKKFEKEEPVEILQNFTGVTLYLSPEMSPKQKYPVQNSELQITNQTILKKTDHPCGGQDRCEFEAQRVEITSKSSISGFRFFNETDYLAKYCFVIGPKSFFQETLRFYNNCTAIEKPWSFCSTSPDLKNHVEISKISRKTVLREDKENCCGNFRFTRNQHTICKIYTFHFKTNHSFTIRIYSFRDIFSQ